MGSVCSDLTRRKKPSSPGGSHDPSVMTEEAEPLTSFEETIRGEFTPGKRDPKSRVHRLLLLGPGESGKSTVVKQMKIMHGDGFSDEVRRSKVVFIRKNLQDAILTIAAAVRARSLPVKDDNLPSLQYMLRLERSDTIPDQEFYNHAERLWGDEGVQECYQYANEYQLIDCAKYFLDRISEIREEDYCPTIEDILRCRVMTTGILQSEFTVKKVKFCVFDVGGQRDERRKWIQCFNDLTALIFVAAISSYNQAVREDYEGEDARTNNRVNEALNLFEFIWKNRWLKHLSVILFLNKEDLLREQCERSRVDEYFEEFSEYRLTFPQTLPSDSVFCKCFGSPTRNQEPDELSEFNMARYFFRNEFEKRATENTDIDIEGTDPSRRDSAATRQLYSHFTCAIDTQNMFRVFKSCQHMIMHEHIRQMQLI